MFYNMFYGITQLNNYMEEDIHNHTLIVMFRGTPCICLLRNRNFCMEMEYC